MVIDLSERAYRRLMTALAHTTMELSGYGLVDVYQGDQKIDMRAFKSLPPQAAYGLRFRIEEIWPLDIGGYGETTIDTKTGAKFLAERLKEGISPARIKLWWHRHPMAAGWSGIDEYAIQAVPLGGDPKEVKWMVSLVWCTSSGWNARYDNLVEPEFTIHIPLTVEGQPQKLELDMQADLHGLAKPMTYTTYSVNTWKGAVYDDADDYSTWVPKNFKNNRTHTDVPSANRAPAHVWAAFLEAQLEDEDFGMLPKKANLFKTYLLELVTHIVELGEDDSVYTILGDMRFHLTKACTRHAVPFDTLWQLCVSAWGANASVVQNYTDIDAEDLRTGWEQL